MSMFSVLIIFSVLFSAKCSFFGTMNWNTDILWSQGLKKQSQIPNFSRKMFLQILDHYDASNTVYVVNIYVMVPLDFHF